MSHDLIRASADLGGDGVLLGRSVQCDGGDVILCGDQQRLVCGSTSGGLGSDLGGASSLCFHQGANQAAVLLPGFFLVDKSLYVLRLINS